MLAGLRSTPVYNTKYEVLFVRSTSYVLDAGGITSQECVEAEPGRTRYSVQQRTVLCSCCVYIHTRNSSLQLLPLYSSSGFLSRNYTSLLLYLQFTSYLGKAVRCTEYEAQVLAASTHSPILACRNDVLRNDIISNRRHLRTSYHIISSSVALNHVYS